MQLNLVLKHRRFYKNPRLIKHFKFRKKELGRHFIARGHLEKLLQKIAKRRSTFHQIKKDTRSIIAHFIRLSKVHRLVRSAHKKTVNRVVSRNKVMLIKLDAMEANRVYSFKLIGRNVDSGLNEIAQNLFELKSNLESKQSSSLLFSDSMPVVNRSYTNFNRFTRRL